MKRGDVVLTVVPRELGRPRPGVIVQADELDIGATTILVCPLSTDFQHSPRLRPIIEPDKGNGLRARSQIMTDKILPLRRDRIRVVLGTLDSEAIDRLDRALLVVLGLAR